MFLYVGYRRTMTGCCLLYFFSKVIFWRADSFAEFLLERLLLAVVLAGMSGVDEALLFLSAGKDTQKAFGIYYAAGEGGQLASALLFSWLMKADYRLAAFSTAVSYGMAAGLALFLKEPPRTSAPFARLPYGEAIKKQGRQFLEALAGIFQDRRLLWFLLGSVLFSEVHHGITVFYGQLQYQQFQIPAAAMGGLYLAMTLLGLSGRWSWEVTKVLGESMAGIWYVKLSVFSCAALCVLGAAASKTPGAFLSVASLFLLRISYSLFAPWSSAWKNQRIREENRAVSLSVCALFSDGVSASVNLLLGNLAERKLPLCMGAGAFLLVLSMASVKRAMKGSDAI